MQPDFLVATTDWKRGRDLSQGMCFPQNTLFSLVSLLLWPTTDWDFHQLYSLFYSLFLVLETFFFSSCYILSLSWVPTRNFSLGPRYFFGSPLSTVHDEADQPDGHLKFLSCVTRIHSMTGVSHSPQWGAHTVPYKGAKVTVPAHKDLRIYDDREIPQNFVISALTERVHQILS